MALGSVVRPVPLFAGAALLRLGLLFYGIWQDANSALKYTDIDYLVFTDAARLVSQGQSPYDRATYRYTPLLAWMLIPTAAPSSSLLFSFGKIIFALADLLAGWFIWVILRENHGMSVQRAGAFSTIWLWNPMVATISTRGSSEGLLGVLTAGLLWAVGKRNFTTAGVILGLGVHFKIYPFIYAPAIIWWMDEQRLGKRSSSAKGNSSVLDTILRFFSYERIWLAAISFGTFAGLNALMYSIYGYPFLEHSYLYHVTRIDHRHNFSPYNILLYLSSAQNDATASAFRPESLAFVLQLLLSCLLIPFAIAKKDLATSMMAQTYAFVTFNKVCTSQYFLWYMIFLPLYLPRSSLLRNPRLGGAALSLWVLGQAAWLQQGYNLEFLGQSTFFPGLWLASLVFFLVNCWILGIIIGDGAVAGQNDEKTQSKY